MPFWHIDTGMAALLILLTVVDEGLGAPAPRDLRSRRRVKPDVIHYGRW